MKGRVTTMTGKITAVLAAAAAFAVLPCAASAQLRFGGRVGVNFATVTGDDVDSDRVDPRHGLLAGAFLEAPLADIVSAELGLQYSQKGFEVNPSGTVTSRLKVDYLEVPALLTVEVSGSESFGFALYLGPTFSFRVKCEGEAGTITGIDCGDNTVKKFDLGADVGAGARFGMGGDAAFLVDAFYNFGFSSIDDDDTNPFDMKNEVISVSAGILLRAG